MLSTVLSSGFNESIADATYTSPFPHNEAFVEDYDYESDSDLDEEEREDGEKESDGKSATTLDVQKRDNTSKCEDITVEGPLFSSNGGVSIDTDNVSMAVSCFSLTPGLNLSMLQRWLHTRIVGSAILSSTSWNISAITFLSVCDNMLTVIVSACRQVIIKDTAFIT